MQAITVRSGRQLDGPSRVEHKKEERREENESLSDDHGISVGEKGKEKVVEEETPSKSKVLIPTIPFAQRLKQNKLEKDIEKFVKIFKQLNINTLYIDANDQIPSYAKFVKEIKSKKRKLEDNEAATLTEDYSA